MSAIALGVLGIWQFHNVEFYSRFDLVPGGRGDNRWVVSILEYLYRAGKGLGSFTSPAFYYPSEGTLGYSDAYLTHALFYGWLRNLGLDIFSCFQICVLAFNLLNYVCCFLLLNRGLSLRVAPSALGAFFFAFNAPKFNQISHTQLQCLFWLPLALWAAAAWVRGASSMGRARAFGLLAAAALALDLQLLTAFYPAWFFLFWSLLFLGFSICLRETRDFLKGLGRRQGLPVLGGAAVLAAGLVPFLGLYLPVIGKLGGKDYSEVQMMIPDFWSFLWMGPRHGWWGWIWDACPAIRHYPVEGEERLGFGITLGVAGIGLALWALGTLRQSGRSATLRTLGMEFKGDRKTYVLFGALALLSSLAFVLLGLQYGRGFSPWWLVYETVPGAQGIRAVSRYVIFLALPFSIVLAFAVQAWWERVRREKKRSVRIWMGGAVLLAVGAALLEQVDFPPYPAFSKSRELNRLEYLSEKLPAQCRAFYVGVAPGLPYSATDIQIDAMLISAVRGIPTLNGYSGQSPRNWDLFKVRSPKYDGYVQNWLSLNGITYPVCGLGIDR